MYNMSTIVLHMAVLYVIFLPAIGPGPGVGLGPGSSSGPGSNPGPGDNALLVRLPNVSALQLFAKLTTVISFIGHCTIHLVV